MLALGRLAAAQRVVSIRARHCWRAMPRDATPRTGSSSFQSAPAIAGGRCHSTFTPSSPRLCFNPRPPLLAGDALSRRVTSARDAVVSIRARHCWRAMRVEPQRDCCLARVSIRARHCWRAMPTRSYMPPHCTVFQSAPAIAGGRCHVSPMNFEVSRAFQSAPAIAGGRCQRPANDGRPARGFQSAPAIAGGRCAHHARRLPRPGCFNPRPPLLAGDASGAGTSPRLSEFQSAPAIAGGRCPILAEHLLTAPPVSIRARHCWRAMPVLRRRGDAGRRFQSAPAIAGGRCRARRGR